MAGCADARRSRPAVAILLWLTGGTVFFKIVGASVSPMQKWQGYSKVTVHSRGWKYDETFA